MSRFFRGGDDDSSSESSWEHVSEGELESESEAEAGNDASSVYMHWSDEDDRVTIDGTTFVISSPVRPSLTPPAIRRIGSRGLLDIHLGMAACRIGSISYPLYLARRFGLGV